MSYDLAWHTLNRVLILTIQGDYALDDAQVVNRLVLDQLNLCQSPLSIIIDARKMSRPYNFNEIRAAQTYMDHRQLKHIYTVAGDPVVKLAMMVIFNLCRAHFHIMNEMSLAIRMIQTYEKMGYHR